MRVGWVPPAAELPFILFGVLGMTLTLYRTSYHNTKTKVPYTPMAATDNTYPVPANSGAYEAGLMTVGEFDTVVSYCLYFNWFKLPSKLECNSNCHLFKSGIQPMWEDDANVTGLFLGSGSALRGAGPLGALLTYALVGMIAYSSVQSPCVFPLSTLITPLPPQVTVFYW